MAGPYESIEHPLNPLCTQWLRKIEDGLKSRDEQFGRYAREAEGFFDSDHNSMWKEEEAMREKGGFLKKGAQGAMPMFRMEVNKPFEAVVLMTPAMYHQNPQISVTPTPIPAVPPEALGLDVRYPQHMEMWEQIAGRHQQMNSLRKTHAGLNEHLVNWLQVEADKKTHARRAIEETIITGLSYLHTEMYSPSGSNVRYPKTRYLSWRDVVVDPDARYWEDVQWVAINCVHAVNLVEGEYGFKPGTLKGQMASKEAQGNAMAIQRERQLRNKNGQSHDLLPYWKIYSKNGFGDRLKTTDKLSYKSKFDFSMFGDFCNIVVAKNVPYPLNMPSWSLAEDPKSLFMRAQWPIPYWTDGGWPFSRMYFYDKPNCVWPVGLFKPVIGELRFVNWCMSFLADKVAQSSTTYIAQLKAAGIEIQDQLQGGLSPFTTIEISDLLGKSIGDVISFLDAPNFSIDIWKMVAEVLVIIDKRTGLTELIYGMSSRQLRTAKEAEVRDQNTSIRPDDMANSVEETLSEVSMKEIEAFVWMGEEKDVIGPLGPDGAKVFMEQIKTQDFDRVVRDYSYRVVAGSARKPNKNTRIANMNDFGQIALPTIQQFALQGVVKPWNAFMSEMAKAMDMDATPFLLPEPEQGQEGPSEEELKAQVAQLEAQLKEMEHAQEMIHDEQTHEQELQQSEEKHDVELDFLRKRGRLQMAGSNGSN